MWVQDLDIFSTDGGAQLTDRAHFIEGLRRSHYMSLLTPRNPLASPSTDLFIISNASQFPLEYFSNMEVIEKPTVWFLHDYWPICKYRLFYPMVDTCKACYLKERWLPYLLRAKLIVWLSPLHRRSWLWLCPELQSTPHHLSPSPVDTGLFKDLELSREGVIAVNSLAPFKGQANVLAWTRDHPQEKVTFLEPNPPEVDLPPNSHLVGFVPNERLNELYNHHSALLHLPQSPSPFDRTVAEAYLAGCKIIGNELIGALSWPWFNSQEDVAEHCRRSPKEFWEAVEKAVM